MDLCGRFFEKKIINVKDGNIRKMAKVTSIVKSNISFDDVKAWYDEHMSPDVIDFDDQDVYKYVYHDARWAGIFQLTSAGAQRLFKKAQPTNIIDIATLTSIYRPGPLAANVDKLYLEAKKGKDYEWPDPRIGQILKKTKGMIIFQEQVMELAEKCAGFPKEECDQVRRAIMKRSISGGEAAKKKAQETRDSFVEGCIANDYDRHVANDLYDKILYFAGYGFNKCFTSKTKILTTDKLGISQVVKSIKDISENDFVFTRDEATQCIVPVKVKQLYDNGDNEIVKVNLTTGESFECTLNHKFRTIETGEMLPLWQIQEQNLSIVVETAIGNLNLKNHSKNMKKSV